MLNYNGEFLNDSHPFAALNRGFLYADAVFETVRVYNNKVLFLEDHYFRLMASMRIIRMEIPMDFTLEFIEQQLLETAAKSQLSHARVRMTVFRNSGGYYTPETRSISWVVTAEPHLEEKFAYVSQPYEVELFKDFHIGKHLLSSLKTTSRTLNVTASIFASENNYQNCLLINEDKNVVEAINGNVFILKEKQLITPPVSDGCINGVMRKQVLALAKKMERWEVLEKSISPFDLQKSDEIFITNVIGGIIPVTKYRKKEFATEAAQQLIVQLNDLLD